MFNSGIWKDCSSRFSVLQPRSENLYSVALLSRFSLLMADKTLHFIYTKSSCDTLQTSPASSTGLRCPLPSSHSPTVTLPLPSGREHYSRHTLGVLLSHLALRLKPHYHHITLKTKFIKQSLVYSKAVVQLETEAKRIHLNSSCLSLQEQVWPEMRCN